MVCHHGAGFSGLSFACFAKEVSKLTQGECGVLSLDAREHGETRSLYHFPTNVWSIGKTASPVPSEDSNLSIETLTDDLVELIKTVFPTPSECPNLLVGYIDLSHLSFMRTFIS